MLQKPKLGKLHYEGTSEQTKNELVPFIVHIDCTFTLMETFDP